MGVRNPIARIAHQPTAPSNIAKLPPSTQPAAGHATQSGPRSHHSTNRPRPTNSTAAPITTAAPVAYPLTAETIPVRGNKGPAVVALRSRMDGWHLNPGFFGTGPWLGDPLISIASLIGPTPGNNFKDGPLYGFARDMEELPTAEGRLQAWFKAQDRIIDQVLMIKLGDMGQSQMMTTKIKGFDKFRTARLWNVWLQN